MKNWIVLFCALGLVACAGVNKNTISYQMSKYDQYAYYVVAGEGNTKEAASANALENMRKSFVQNVPEVNFVEQLNDIMANAQVDKVWRDKSQKDPKNYFALAVLKRQTAELILQVPANALDAQMGALASKLQATEDKFVGLRAAFSMEPLILKRNIVQDLYIFISQDHAGYESERFENYKKLYHDRLSSVKVAVIVRGEENDVLLARLIDAVNQMGLSAVSPNDPTALLSVETDARVDGYGSERLKGLEWAATSASVYLRDLQAGTTFASFTLHDRAGTGRKEDSVRKSMESLGSRASTEIVKRLTNYLKTK
ncbi:MAG: hypothetical protein IJ311_02270 [Elusimicrobiaceae bacterium]|nr:hypothetical protein [Elusimicrobiaceae bacterium]